MIEVQTTKTTLLKAVELSQLYIEDQLSNGRHEIAPVQFISGGPGIGKSAVLTQLGLQLKSKDGRAFRVKTEHPALRPLEMFSGIPEIIQGKNGELVTRWSRPEIVTLDTDEEKEYMIWFWDDVHLLDPNQAKYCFELLTYRKLHNYRIPDNVVMIWAGNYSKEAGARNILSPIINRLGIYHVDNPVEDWADMYISGRTLEDLQEEGRFTLVEIDPENVVKPHPSVVSFLLRFPEFANEKEDVREPFGTYRAWTFIGRILERYFQKIAPYKSSKEIASDIRLIVSAHATPKAAAEYENYYKVYIKFDPNQVLIEGKFFDYSNDQVERTIELYASTYATSKAFTEKYHELKQKKRGREAERMFDNYVKFFNHLYTKYGSEPGVAGMLVRALHYIKTELINKKYRMELINRLNPANKGKMEIFDEEFIKKRYRAASL